jgi:hypothetical protein
MPSAKVCFRPITDTALSKRHFASPPALCPKELCDYEQPDVERCNLVNQ